MDRRFSGMTGSGTQFNVNVNEVISNRYRNADRE